MVQSRVIRNIRLGVKSLLLHKLRSLLTMLGVVFGVGSVVAMLSVGEGASAQAQEQIERLGSNNIIISSVKPEEDRQTNLSGRRSYLTVYGLKYDDEARITECHPSVLRTVPAKLVPQEARVGEQAQEVRVVGTTPDWFDLVKRDVIAGRVMTWLDVKNALPVCVLSEEAGRQLLANRHTIGQNVRVGGEYFTVVGIVRTEQSEGGGVQTPDRSADVYIPINVVRERFGDIITVRTSGSFMREMVELHQLIVQVDELPNVIPTSDAIASMLGMFHKKPDYNMSVPLALLRQARETQRIFNIVLGSIAGISLLVGGIGIMNIMLASVTERTREIGVRRAIGAKRRQIIGQFLIETVVLSTVGGLMGVGLGLGIPWLIEFFAQMPTKVTMWSVMLSLGISAMVGIIFGLYPAIRAANLDPIVALRHE